MKDNSKLFDLRRGKRLENIVDALPPKFNCMYMGLYGSQNYMLDDENSDVDAKAIVIPSLNDLIESNEVSTSYTNDNDEILDVKDIRVMFKQFLKSNVNFLEILFTNDYIYNKEFSSEVAAIRDMREDIARYDIKTLVKANYGMMINKFKSLTKVRPSTEKVITLYGYSGKDACHIVRMSELINNFIVNGMSFKSSLDVRNSGKEHLMRMLKKNDYNGNLAIKVCEKELEKTKALVDRVVESNEYYTNLKVRYNLKDIEKSVIEKALKASLE